MLTFDEASHTYKWNGEPVPGVTQILADVGLIDYTDLPLSVRDMALERGRLVHTVTHWDDEADLDESTVDLSIMPYLTAWRRFRWDTGFVPLLIEDRCYHPLYKYAGTVDRMGMYEGFYAVVDIKTNVGPPFVLWQLAAYAHLLEDSRKYRRLCVELRADETYRVIEARMKDHMEHWNVFASALTVFRAKQAAKQSLRRIAA